MNPFLEKYNNKIVILLLLIMFVLMFFSARQNSLISDENFYLGYTYLKTNDFRFDSEQPPLIKEITAFPLLFLDLKLTLADEWEQANEFLFSRRFLFNDNKDKYDLILLLARLPIMLLALLLGYFIYLFAKRLYGLKAGLFALFLYSFCPNILAHAQLATTDFALTAFTFISFYFFWRLLNNMNYKNLVLFSLFFAFSQMSKHSALFLFLVLFVILIIKLVLILKNHQKVDYKKLVLFFIVFLIINQIVLIACYGFNFNGLYNVEERIKLVNHITKNKAAATVIYPVIRIVPIPTQYLVGLNEVIRHSKAGHNAYLMGNYSEQGWWYYFPVAFLVKMPVAMILFILLSLLFFKKIHHPHWFNEFFVLSFIITYLAIFMLNNINIGLRHILPIYPFLFVFVSKLINYQKLKLLIIILSIWYLISSIIIYPHYLAYFNELVGGPDNGYKYLIDSNLDWGQDIKGLAVWMRENNVESINARVFGTEELDFRGIKHEQLRCYTDGRKTRGLLAISVNEIFDKYNNNCFDYLLKEKPIAKIGYSIWVFDVRE